MKWAKSNFLGNRCLSFSFFFCLFLMFADLPSHAQSQAMKRGRDWMGLKRYDEAISEFAHAIREEPKNVEARYLVARCYHLKNDPLSSLNWIRETLSVAPSHPAALSLRTAIQTEGIGYLSSSDKRMQSLGLHIVEQVPSGAAIPALRSLMASSDQGLASASEKLMLKIDARQARAVWISWLSSSDLRLKETGAERLWSSERYPQAAPILRKKYERVFMAAQEEYGAKQAAFKLADLGWPEAVDTLAAALRPAPKMPQAVVAADMFAQRKERRAVPALEGAFSAWLPGGERYKACGPPYPQLANALGLIGAKEAVRLLKEALSNYLSSQMAFMDNTCVETYLGSLAVLDGDAWKSFKYFYDRAGWTEHRKVILDLEGAKGDRGTGTGQDPVDENSPNAQKIRAWLQKLGPVTAFGEGIRLETLGNYVKIQSPTEMRYYGEINYSYKIRGAYLLILRATEDPKRAWVVTDVQERPCDRCGQIQGDLPASLEGVNPSSVKPPLPPGPSSDLPPGEPHIQTGEFAKTAQPVTLKTGCDAATDLCYALLAGGHLYKVKIIASSTGQVHAFLDEKGALVQNPELLQKLALGAWTREKIVKNSAA